MMTPATDIRNLTFTWNRPAFKDLLWTNIEKYGSLKQVCQPQIIDTTWPIAFMFIIVVFCLFILNEC